MMWWCLRSFSLFHRWMSRTVSMIVYQHHTLERMNDDAQLQMCMNRIENFHTFCFSLYKCRYIYIYITKSYTSIQLKKKTYNNAKKNNRIIINKHCSNKFSFDNNQILVHR
jgi:hypothetical protein